MMRESEESVGTSGLGIIDGIVSKIKDNSLKLPLLGWYDVKFKENIFESRSYFFNNNYSVNLKEKQLNIWKIK